MLTQSMCLCLRKMKAWTSFVKRLKDSLKPYSDSIGIYSSFCLIWLEFRPLSEPHQRSRQWCLRQSQSQYLTEDASHNSMVHNLSTEKTNHLVTYLSCDKKIMEETEGKYSLDIYCKLLITEIYSRQVSVLYVWKTKLDAGEINDVFHSLAFSKTVCIMFPGSKVIEVGHVRPNRKGPVFWSWFC